MANERMFVASAWYIKLTCLVHSIQSVETSTIKEEEKCGVFYRIDWFGIETVTHTEIICFLCFFIYNRQNEKSQKCKTKSESERDFNTIQKVKKGGQIMQSKHETRLLLCPCILRSNSCAH